MGRQAFGTHMVCRETFLQNPAAFSSTPSPQQVNPWSSHTSKQIHSSTAEQNENQTPVQDQRCQSGPSESDFLVGQSIILSEIKAEVLLENHIPSHQNLLLQRDEERIKLLSQENKVSKFCMDAGFMRVVEVGQYFMTKDTGEQFYAVACREYTLPRNDESSQPKGWIQGNTRIGFVLEVTTSCLWGKYGIEIWIWSLRKDTHSWVRNSHGALWVRDRFKSQQHRSSCRSTWRTSVTVVWKLLQPDQRQKQNHKREKLLNYWALSVDWYWTSRIIFPCVGGLEESRSTFFDTLKRYNEKTTEQFNSGGSRIFFRINFHK